MLLFDELDHLHARIKAQGNDHVQYASAPGPGRFDGLYWRLGPGIVADTCKLAGSYKVHIQHRVLICTALHLVGGFHATMTSAPHYLPGDHVLIGCADGSDYGVILGSLPHDTDRTISAPVTAWSQGNPPDDLSKGPFLAGRPDLEAFPLIMQNRDIHATDLGAFFIGSALGAKLSLDPFCALLAASDCTGVWAFTDDNYLRLGGYNYEHLTSGSLTQHLNDRGSLHMFTGYCTYPWEAYGYYRKPTSILREVPDWQETDEAIWEPTDPLARPFHRLTTYYGYLGQGSHTQISAPHADIPQATYSPETSDTPALMRELRHIDGTYALESAKSIFFRKRPPFPSVQPIQVPNSDTPLDPPAQRTGDFTFSPDAQRCLQLMAGLDDFLTYLFNYRALEPFLAHRQEFLVPEDATSRSLPSLTDLRTQQFLAAPTIQRLDIDETLRQQEYYANEAGFGIFPDGSFVVYDGYGSSITMGGGTITFSAPGDIWVKSGRNTILWSGRDLEMRAFNSADLSTTTEGIRIKAEGQLSMLGGNAAKDKGVLIESRGKASAYNFDQQGDQIAMGGICLKATDSACAVLGKMICLQSDKRGEGILIDSGAGNQSVTTLARSENHYLQQQASWNFGVPSRSTVTGSVEFTKNAVACSGAMRLGGSLSARGPGQFDGSLISGGHIITRQAATTPLVAPLKDEALVQFEDGMRMLYKECTRTLPERYGALLSDSVYPLLYDPGRIGSVTPSFSFRTQEEYHTDGFLLFEDRWQGFPGVTPWPEPPVGDGSYPYPGSRYYEGEPCYVSQELTLREGMKRDDPAYQKPGFGKLRKASIHQYRIIGKG